MKVIAANLLLALLVGASVTVIWIMRDAGETEPCPHNSGVIFVDCVNPQWRAISSWETRYDNSSQHINTSGDNQDLVRWEVIETRDPSRGAVIDVRYSDVPANGRLRFHTARLGDSADMSAYAGGSVQFDIRMLDWGRPRPGMVVNFSCQQPCTTGVVPLTLQPGKRWQKQRIAVDHLVGLGLDLSHVDIGLAISPLWNSMHGAHFQLDNIRWVKEGED
ncbi:hypothetical protein WKI13_01210 [Teredinibacter turnerae]|uniref:hypothetical protein n=1 Tax=Teredinibacter turnerae TaxID=2426 RepID=UPI00036C6663|nr:hypothetical protein [Teredinibacter turnerae]